MLIVTNGDEFLTLTNKMERVSMIMWKMKIHTWYTNIWKWLLQN